MRPCSRPWLSLWVLVGLPYGRHRLKAAERAWLSTFLTDQQFNERYPSHQHSRAALRLDALVRTCGTFIAATPADWGEGASRDTPALKQVRDFVGAMRKQRSDRPYPIPPDVERFASGHVGTLNEIEDVLLDAAPVEWKTPAGGEQPVGFLGVRNVADLLLARSLIEDARGERAARDRALEASWRLEESIWRRAMVIDKLIAIAVGGDRNGCLRRFRSPRRRGGVGYRGANG